MYNGEAGDCYQLIEYEIKFDSIKIGLRFRNLNNTVVVATYEGPELEMLEDDDGMTCILPQVAGAVLVGVNGQSIEHLDFHQSTKLLANAGRPIRMRFRESIRVNQGDNFFISSYEEEVGVEDPQEDESTQQTHSCIN